MSTQFVYEGGDHIIRRRSAGFDRMERAPLLYVTDGFAIASPRSPDVPRQVDRAMTVGCSTEPAGISAWPSPPAVHERVPAHIRAIGLSDADFYILSSWA